MPGTQRGQAKILKAHSKQRRQIQTLILLLKLTSEHWSDLAAAAAEHKEYKHGYTQGLYMIEEILISWGKLWVVSWKGPLCNRTN